MTDRSRPFFALRALGCWAAMLGYPAASAHAFDRMNVLVHEVPLLDAPPPAMELPWQREGHLPLRPFGVCAAGLGEALLMTDRARDRILRLEDGDITALAGRAQYQHLLFPNAPPQAALGTPQRLLVLRDQSVLVSHNVGKGGASVVVRIHPGLLPQAAAFSVFAGNGKNGWVIDPASAPGTSLGQVTSMVQERDGSVLLAELHANRVLRIGPDGQVRVLAGTGIAGDLVDPASGGNTQLSDPQGLAVLADGSVLIADQRRVLRVRNHAVTVYAGAAPIAEHAIELRSPRAIAVLPDGSVCLLDHGLAGECARLLRITAQGVSQMAGPNLGGVTLEPGYRPDGNEGDLTFCASMIALRDGSLVLGPGLHGVLLFSPADALQTRLEALVDQGKAAVRAMADPDQAAVRAEKLQAYGRAELELTCLTVPSSNLLRAVNRSARDQLRLEPPDLEPSLHLVPRLVQMVSEYANSDVAERWRAQLALKELRKFKKDWLGR